MLLLLIKLILVLVIKQYSPLKSQGKPLDEVLKHYNQFLGKVRIKIEHINRQLKLLDFITLTETAEDVLI